MVHQTNGRMVNMKLNLIVLDVVCSEATHAAVKAEEYGALANKHPQSRGFHNMAVDYQNRCVAWCQLMEHTC
jgi:hypothetical protein